MPDLIELQSSVERVEVFRSEALVTRRCVVPLSGLSGKVNLLLTGLPLSLRESSVRLDLARDAGIRVSDLHLGFSVGQRDSEVRTAAEQELRDLVRERMGLEVAGDQQRSRLGFLESLQPSLPAAEDMPEKLAYEERPVVDAWLELAEFVRRGQDECRVKIRQLERQGRALSDRIRQAGEALERESQAELEALAVCRKTARVQLEISKPLSDLELRLSYLVPGARWVPEYELRVYAARDEAELVLRALVAQRSGEDWEKAGLAFSTADLRRSTELPELDSWRIGKSQPERASGWRPLPEGLDELFESYDSGVRSMPLSAEVSTPSLPSMPRIKDVSTVLPRKRKVDKDQLIERIQNAAMAKQAELAADLNVLSAPEPGYSKNDFAKQAFDEEEIEECCAEAAPMDMMDDGAPPMPPPSAAPMPMSASMAPPAPEAKSMKKRRSKGKPFAGKRNRKAGRGAAQEKEMSRAMSGGGLDLADHMDEFGLDGLMEDLELEASTEALGFQTLRMKGPDSGSMRGQLKAASVAERVRDSVSQAPEAVRDAVSRVPSEVWNAAVRAPSASLAGLSLPRHAVDLSQSAGNFAVRYPMESLGSVPPDGQLHSLTLLRKRGSVTRVFRCVPLLDDHVYQMVEFNNPLDLPLLAGPVRVYREGDYVVSSPLWTTPPGKTLTVNLGVEQAMVVARNVHYSESTEGLFGGDTALEHEVEIEVRSRLSQPAQVEIFERVPYSSDDDIKVEVVKTVPQAEQYKQTERGRLIRGGWRFAFEIQPHKKVTCKLSYRVTIPSKQVLVGGNRRD